MTEKPNILVLMNDEHRPDVAGYADDSVIRTPTLDWLASTGTVFTNAYSPAPVCVPARHSMRTGKLPRTWARDDFDTFESGTYETTPRRLSKHGYMAVQSGKEHYPGFAQMQGWRKRLGPTPMKREIGDDMENMIEPYKTEDYSKSDWKWTAGKEIKRAGVANSRIQIQDRQCVEATEQFVKDYFAAPYYDRAQPDRPLILKTSLIQPHYPFFTDESEKFTYYLNRVDPYVEESEDIHPIISEAETAGECRIVEPGEDASEREIRRATAAYYAMIERVDDLFGRLINALEQNGEDIDDWVIVFTSDHGEMLGERSMWGKGQFLDPSVRVPLIIRCPERFKPGVVEENVNLCDLYSTLCSLGDIPVPSGLDSRSLIPLLEGKTHDWHKNHKNETISQGVGNRSIIDGINTNHLMIKRDHLKYCYYGEEHSEVLFDLERDPDEKTNIINNSSYKDSIERFRERRGELGYGPNADPNYKNAGYLV